MTDVRIKKLYYKNNIYAYKIFEINYLPQMTGILMPLGNQLVQILAICILCLVDSPQDSLETQAVLIPCLALLHKQLLKHFINYRWLIFYTLANQ